MGLRFRRNDQPATPAESEEDRFATIAPGVPGRCPECDGFGYIDHADLVSRTQVQHCRDCGHRWEYRFDREGTLIELRDLGEPGARAGAVRELDLTDGDATITDQDDAPGADDDDVLDLTDAAVTDRVDDEADEVEATPSIPSPDGRSAAEWLRDAARHT